MEKIKTYYPVIEDRSKITREIATFWNKASEGFRTIWGPHIHHGYFDDRGETPIEAQEKLIEKLVGLLEILPLHKILDAGCGMGGSSFYLARKYGAAVTGVSLSQRQVDIATRIADRDGIKNVSFKVEDALSLASFPANEFDLVWSLESCEQFYDKELFVEQAFRVLKPGGRLMLATWCSSADEYQGEEAKKYIRLCKAFQLPYMPTIDHYVQLLQQKGFIKHHVLNWSAKVEKSWKIGLSSVKARSFLKVLKSSGWRGLVFIKNAKMMHYGFQEGRVEYGVFVVRKPSKISI
jgi:tocopherol O-methyltransferase